MPGWRPDWLLVCPGFSKSGGNAREPQIFLADGDVVVTRVPGLGELHNTVRRTALT